MGTDILCSDCEHRRQESGKNYVNFLSPSWQWASDAHSSHLHIVHNLPLFPHGQQYQPSLVYTPTYSYMHLSGKLLVIYSASSTMQSRPKMADGYDDQRKSSELSIKDLKVN